VVLLKESQQQWLRVLIGDVSDHHGCAAILNQVIEIDDELLGLVLSDHSSVAEMLRPGGVVIVISISHLHLHHGVDGVQLHLLYLVAGGEGHGAIPSRDGVRTVLGVLGDDPQAGVHNGPALLVLLFTVRGLFLVNYLGFWLLLVTLVPEQK